MDGMDSILGQPVNAMASFVDSAKLDPTDDGMASFDQFGFGAQGIDLGDGPLMLGDDSGPGLALGSSVGASMGSMGFMGGPGPGQGSAQGPGAPGGPGGAVRGQQSVQLGQGPQSGPQSFGQPPSQGHFTNQLGGQFGGGQLPGQFSNSMASQIGGHVASMGGDVLGNILDKTPGASAGTGATGLGGVGDPLGRSMSRAGVDGAGGTTGAGGDMFDQNGLYGQMRPQQAQQQSPNFMMNTPMGAMPSGMYGNGTGMAPGPGGSVGPGGPGGPGLGPGPGFGGPGPVPGMTPHNQPPPGQQAMLQHQQQMHGPSPPPPSAQSQLMAQQQHQAQQGQPAPVGLKRGQSPRKPRPSGQTKQQKVKSQQIKQARELQGQQAGPGMLAQQYVRPQSQAPAGGMGPLPPSSPRLQAQLQQVQRSQIQAQQAQHRAQQAQLQVRQAREYAQAQAQAQDRGQKQDDVAQSQRIQKQVQERAMQAHMEAQNAQAQAIAQAQQAQEQYVTVAREHMLAQRQQSQGQVGPGAAQARGNPNQGHAALGPGQQPLMRPSSRVSMTGMPTGPAAAKPRVSSVAELKTAGGRPHTPVVAPATPASPAVSHVSAGDASGGIKPPSSSKIPARQFEFAIPQPPPPRALGMVRNRVQYVLGINQVLIRHLLDVTPWSEAFVAALRRLESNLNFLREVQSRNDAFQAVLISPPISGPVAQIPALKEPYRTLENLFRVRVPQQN